MPDDAATTPQGGREATIAALVDAATRLFAAHGPDGVALRAVAAEAGVNYGLIHQYVGTKEDLLRLVVRSLSESSARSFEANRDLDAVVAGFIHEGHTPYVAMLTWALLQGRDARELLGRSPALDALRGLVGDGPGRDARIAAVVALSLGWQIFGAFLSAGLGHDADTDDDLTASIRAIARNVLADPTIAAGAPPI